MYEVAAVERQLADFVSFDHTPKGAACGFHLDSTGLDSHLLTHTTYHQSGILGSRAARVDRNVFEHELLKIRGFDTHRVCAHRKIGFGVDSARISNGVASLTRALILDGDLRA